MACRYRILADGRRQILSFLLPGDFCELHTYLLKAMDHSVVTLTAGRLAVIERAAITTLVARYPRIGAAIWWSSMQEAAIMRERIVGLGRRSARGRVAYILCELVWRQREVGLAEDHTIRLALTQTDIADTLGLTPSCEPRPTAIPQGGADHIGAAAAAAARYAASAGPGAVDRGLPALDRHTDRGCTLPGRAGALSPDNSRSRIRRAAGAA